MSVSSTACKIQNVASQNNRNVSIFKVNNYFRVQFYCSTPLDSHKLSKVRGSLSLF